jgi:anti-anti-sigma factor
VVLEGDLDIATAPILRSHLDLLMGHVLIDCREVAFVDSVGLGELMRLASHVESIVLARPRDQLRRVVELMGLSETLGVTGNVPPG